VSRYVPDLDFAALQSSLASAIVDLVEYCDRDLKKFSDNYTRGSGISAIVV
jgi:hypothetical protein